VTTVGTITYHDSINYGAILQAYALQKALTDMGYDSEIIDYRKPHRGTANLSGFRRWRHFIWDNAIKQILVGNERQRKTEGFVHNNLGLSKLQYLNSDTLRSEPPLYDAYITGSDQVWNPTNNSNDSSYFLEFAPPGKRRISYAASFGVSQIPDRFVGDYRDRLKKLDFISTREIEGKQIIEQLSGREAEITLDPTLLLNRDEWDRIAVPFNFSKPYILCYYMPGDKTVNQSITELARYISSVTGWSIISIGQKEYARLLFWRKSVYDAGPSEFIGLFQKASFVVTNSFHGTAFSINYRKPFLVPVNPHLSPEKSLSSRILSLLRTLELEDRILPTGTSLQNEEILSIDYEKAETILAQERKKSICFLKKALGDV